MITSKDNETVKHISKLVKSASYRNECGLFTAEGVRICRDGVLSGFKPEIFVYTPSSKEKYEEDFEFIAGASKKLLEVSNDIFSRISDTKSPQGLFCVFTMLDKREFPYTINKRGSYLALERVQDPSNIGTILRTAEALGIDGVIMSNDCCSVFSPKVVRGSMGAVFRLPILIADDFLAYIRSAASDGVKTYASSPVGNVRITDIKFDGGIMLIGNEGAGLSEEAIKACSETVTIPMKGRAESLNAAAAAALLMWEMLRE